MATENFFGRSLTTSSSPYPRRFVEKFIATSGQTIFTLTTTTYATGSSQLMVFVNGKLKAPSSYTETNPTTITFTSGLVAGDVVVLEGLKFSTQYYDSSAFRKDLAGGLSNNGGSLINTSQPFTGSVNRTVTQKVLDWVSVADFGVKGDGSEETTKIQAALSSGAKNIYFPAGTYYGKNLGISSNTRIYGDGPLTTLLLAPSAAATDVLLKTIAAYTVSNIIIENMTLNGNAGGAGATQTRTTEMVSMLYMNNLTIRNVNITNIQYTGLLVAGSRNVRIEGCTFNYCGWNGSAGQCGPALWIVTYDSGYQPQDHIISNCLFTDNQWYGIYYSGGIRGQITGCKFGGNRDAHIIGTATDLIVSNNTFDSAILKSSYGHAIYLNGIHLSITGNVIRQCDAGGIKLEDVKFATVTGNIIGNVNKGYRSTTGIDINSFQSVPNAITIVGNTIYDDTASVTASYAMQFVNGGGAGSGAVTNLIVAHNMCESSWAGGSTFSFGTIGTGCRILSNIGIPSATSDITT